MIIRQSVLRQGPTILSRPTCRPWPRYLSSNGVNRTATAVENTKKQTHPIELIPKSPSSSSQPLIQPDETGDHEPDTAARDYQIFRRQKKLHSQLGSVMPSTYQPTTPQNVTLELLLAAQSHLGHATSLWHPGNQRYIFGIRQGIHIISLDVTATYLRRAAKVVTEVCERAGLVLFVGNRPGQRSCVVEAARLAGGCHLFDRWIPGAITNGQQILGGCSMKVVDEFDRDLPGFKDKLHDQAVLKPDLVVCLNPLENYVLLHECRSNTIPTIGVVDTDCNPAWVTYPIPANDDSLRCVGLIAKVLGHAGEHGQKRRRAFAEEGKVTYTPDKKLQEMLKGERGGF